jgi:hypothetical protein
MASQQPTAETLSARPKAAEAPRLPLDVKRHGPALPAQRLLESYVRRRAAPTATPTPKPPHANPKPAAYRLLWQIQTLLPSQELARLRLCHQIYLKHPNSNLDSNVIPIAAEVAKLLPHVKFHLAPCLILLTLTYLCV